MHINKCQNIFFKVHVFNNFIFNKRNWSVFKCVQGIFIMVFTFQIWKKKIMFISTVWIANGWFINYCSSLRCKLLTLNSWEVLFTDVMSDRSVWMSLYMQFCAHPHNFFYPFRLCVVCPVGVACHHGKGWIILVLNM